jgi:hypothetical protein
VRAAGYEWPISGGNKREIHLSWVASDPVMHDPTEHAVSAFAGSSVQGGRAYDLVYDRAYVAGGGYPTTGVISSPGDFPLRPRLDIYGPITDPVVTLEVYEAGTYPLDTYRVQFVTGFIVAPNDHVTVDTDARTVTTAAGDSLMSQLDWAATTWPILPPAPAQTFMSLAGTSTSGVTQVVATWNDGYLT